MAIYLNRDISPKRAQMRAQPLDFVVGTGHRNNSRFFFFLAPKVVSLAKADVQRLSYLRSDQRQSVARAMKYLNDVK